MAAYFLESSALLKRYVNEPGTDVVVALTAPDIGRSLYVCRIALVEVVAAIARRRKGKTIRPKTAAVLLQRARGDFLSLFRVVEVSPQLLTDAVVFADRFELRAYDAVQLAAAALVKQNLAAANLPPLTFVSADRELNAGATAERLTVTDPTVRP